jgi:hypothetical protein
VPGTDCSTALLIVLFAPNFPSLRPSFASSPSWLTYKTSVVFGPEASPEMLTLPSIVTDPLGGVISTLPSAVSIILPSPTFLSCMVCLLKNFIYTSK